MIESRIQDDRLIITLQNEVIDAAQAPEFRQSLFDAINEASIYRVVIDLSNVTFIDSSGLGVFLSALRHLDDHHGELKLAAMSKSVHAMFQIVRMHKLFETYPTVDAALSGFAAGSTREQE